MLSIISAVVKVLSFKGGAGVTGALISGKVASIGASALVVTLTASAAAASLTGAVFTDSDSVSGNAFSTGNVDISNSPTSAVVSLTDMAPGDSIVAPLTVSNDGSLELRYAITSTTTEGVLAAQLDMTIKSGVSSCNAGGFDSDGSQLYSGDIGSVSGINVVGDPAQGDDSGDRTLAASASEALCIKVALPLATDNSYQNISTTASFAFAADQTANNS